MRTTKIISDDCTCYRLNRQNTVAQYIATRPLLDLCEGASARAGTRVPLRWWNQKGIDWETAKARGEEEGEETDSSSGSESSEEEEKRIGGEGGGGEQSERIKRSGVEWSECRRVGGKLRIIDITCYLKARV